MSEVSQLRKEVEDYRVTDKERYEQLLEVTTRNATNIEALTGDVNKLLTNTSDIIKLYKDVRGAVRVGVGVRKFLNWLITFGAAGAFIVAVILYIIDKFSPPV